MVSSKVFVTLTMFRPYALAKALRRAVTGPIPFLPPGKAVAGVHPCPAGETPSLSPSTNVPSDGRFFLIFRHLRFATKG